MHEEQIKHLRDVHGGPASIAMCREAADALENQQREIEALKQIIEKQAGLNQKLADMALELDQVKAERDAAAQCLREKCLHIESTQYGARCNIDDVPCDGCENIWRDPQKEK